jgi:hypothetical protein
MSEMSVKEKREALLRKIRVKAGVVADFMNSELGKKFIAALEESFYEGDMVGETPYDTYFNLGRRDVVEFLKSLQRINERDKDHA